MAEVKTARDNVQITKVGDDLIIRVKANLEFGKSSTGKSTMVATTGGFVEHASGLRISLNVVK